MFICLTTLTFIYIFDNFQSKTVLKLCFFSLSEGVSELSESERICCGYAVATRYSAQMERTYIK